MGWVFVGWFVADWLVGFCVGFEPNQTHSAAYTVHGQPQKIIILIDKVFKKT